MICMPGNWSRAVSPPRRNRGSHYPATRCQREQPAAESDISLWLRRPEGQMRTSHRGEALADTDGVPRALSRCHSACAWLARCIHRIVEGVSQPRQSRNGNIPQEAPDNMLQQPGRLLLDQLAHHVAKDGADSVESLIGGADVVQAIVVKQDLLHNEDGDSLTELRARLHDAQTERDDLGGQQEVDDL